MKLLHAMALGSAAVLMLFFFGCEPAKSKDFVGSAVVEAKTFQIATTSQGTIVSIDKDEGMPVVNGELVAVIDTVPLVLKLQELSSAISQLGQTIAAKKAEIESQEFDVKGVQREFNRVAGLVDKGALPAQQKDNYETQFASIKLKMKANKLSLESLLKQEKTFTVQVSQLMDQLKRCKITAFSNGIILTRYKNLGEVVMPGNPLFEVGKYDTMEVDFYVTQPMLVQFHLGQKVRIRLDNPSVDKKETFVPAYISWIGNDAEFSPKNIQTRESRNELVFKIRALVPNSQGFLKRGLPVEVWR